MKQYIVKRFVYLPAGTRFRCNHHQAFIRRGRIRELGGGEYEAVNEPRFQAGQRIWLDTDDKAMLDCLEPVAPAPVKDPVKKPTVKKPARKKAGK